jgi:hypothetical protein
MTSKCKTFYAFLIYIKSCMWMYRSTLKRTFSLYILRSDTFLYHLHTVLHIITSRFLDMKGKQDQSYKR